MDIALMASLAGNVALAVGALSYRGRARGAESEVKSLEAANDRLADTNARQSQRLIAKTALAGEMRDRAEAAEAELAAIAKQRLANLAKAQEANAARNAAKKAGAAQ